jgi:hypothetical protein
LTGGAEDRSFVAGGGNRDQVSDFTDRAALAAAVKSGRIDVGLVTAVGAAAAVANDPELELISPFLPPTVDASCWSRMRRSHSAKRTRRWSPNSANG